jgi:hypothetical protein
VTELQGWKEQIADAYKLSPAETRQILDSVSQQMQGKGLTLTLKLNPPRQN